MLPILMWASSQHVQITISPENQSRLFSSYSYHHHYLILNFTIIGILLCSLCIEHYTDLTG